MILIHDIFFPQSCLKLACQISNLALFEKKLTFD